MSVQMNTVKMSGNTEVSSQPVSNIRDIIKGTLNPVDLKSSASLRSLKKQANLTSRNIDLPPLVDPTIVDKLKPVDLKSPTHAKNLEYQDPKKANKNIGLPPLIDPTIVDKLKPVDLKSPTHAKNLEYQDPKKVNKNIGLPPLIDPTIVDKLNPIRIDYKESKGYVSDEQLTKDLKNNQGLISSSYWKLKEGHESRVEVSGDVVGIAGGVAAGIAGAAVGSRYGAAIGIGIFGTLGAIVGTLIVPGPGTVEGMLIGAEFGASLGAAVGATVLGGLSYVGGEIAGEITGEDVVAPSIEYFSSDVDARERSKLKDGLKFNYHIKYDDKWEGIDVKETMKLYPPGPSREALYEAFMERSKHRSEYSQKDLANLNPTVDKAGNEGYLLPGNDPTQRPNIGVDIRKTPEPIAVVGVYGDKINEKRRNNKLQKINKLNTDKLSPQDLNKVSGHQAELGKLFTPVLPRIEVFLNLHTGKKNLIVYLRPNQVAQLLNSKRGAKAKDQIKRLPELLSKQALGKETIDKFESNKDLLNSSFRLSIPLDGTIEEGWKNMNVGYLFEWKLLKVLGKTSRPVQKLMNNYASDLYVAFVVRTIPSNSLDRDSNGPTYFMSGIAYVANDGKQPNNDSKQTDNDSKQTDNESNDKIKSSSSDSKAKTIKNNSSALGLVKSGVGHVFNSAGVYLAAGYAVDIANIDTSGKVINTDGEEVYTTNINLGASPDFISTSIDKNPSDYYQLPAKMTRLIDTFNP